MDTVLLKQKDVESRYREKVYSNLFSNYVHVNVRDRLCQVEIANPISNPSESKSESNSESNSDEAADGNEVSEGIEGIQSRVSNAAHFELNIDLLSYFITLYSDPSELLLDPFAGTGSLARAAMSSNRRVVSVEINPALASLMKKSIITKYKQVQILFFCFYRF